MALPTYTANQQVQVTPNPGDSAAWDTLGKLFGNVEQKIGQVRAEQAQAADQANKYLTQADVIQNTGRLYNQAQQNPNAEEALKQFSNSADGYSQGLLQSTPNANKPYVQYLLASQIQGKLNTLNGRLATQNKATADGAWQTTFETTLNEAANMNASDPENPNTKIMNAQIAPMVDTAANLGLIDGKQAAIYKLNAAKQLTSSNALGTYNRFVQSGNLDAAAQYKQSFLDSNNDLYNPTEKMAIEGHMDAFQSLQAQNEGITTQTVNNTLKSVVLRAQQTGNGPTAQEQSILQLGNPKEWDNTKNQISAAQLQNGYVQQNSNGSIGEMQQGIAKLSQPLTDAESADPNANLTQAAKHGAIAQLTKNIKQWNNDPAQATSEDPNFQQRSGVLQTQIVNTQPTLQNGQPNPVYQTQQMQFVRAQDQIALNVQAAKGIAPNKMSLISSGDAANAVAQIRTLPMAQQVQALTQIQQRYGENNQYVFPQLVKNGLPIASNYVMAMQNNPQSLGMLPTAIQAFSTPVKDLEASLPSGIKSKDILNSVKDKLNDYVNSLGPNATGTLVNNIYAQANHLALQLAVHGESSSKAAEDAANSLINNHYQYNTFNGQTYRIPQGTDPALIQRGVSYLKNLVSTTTPDKLDIKVPSYLYPGLPQNVRESLYFDNSVSRGYVLTNQDDTGIQFVDGYGAPILNKNGQPYEASFQDLTNPLSSIYKQAHTASGMAHAKNIVDIGKALLGASVPVANVLQGGNSQ